MKLAQFYGKSSVFCLQHNSSISHMSQCSAGFSVDREIICFSSPPGLRGPLSTYLYIFYLGFILKDYFHAQMMWSVARPGNVSSPNIMIKFIFLLHAFFIWLVQLSSEKQLLPIWICSRGRCVWIWTNMISFCRVTYSLYFTSGNASWAHM